ARIERPALAGEVLDLLARRAKEEPAGPDRKPRRWWSGGRPQSGASGPVESTALAALAFARVRPRTPEPERTVDWLLAHRRGTDWRPHQATGPALAALAAYYVGAQAAGDRYRLTVAVNGREVYKAEVTGQTEGRAIAVPRATLKPNGTNRVTFD